MNNGGNSGGNKPAIKVAIKARSGEGGRISVCAAWRDEQTGRLRASFDRRVTRFVMLLDDGTKVDAQRGEDGKWSHYVDVFENDAPQNHAQGRAPGRAASRSVDDLLGTPSGSSAPYSPRDFGGGDVPPDDFGGDEIPFDRLRGEWR